MRIKINLYLLLLLLLLLHDVYYTFFNKNRSDQNEFQILLTFYFEAKNILKNSDFSALAKNIILKVGPPQKTYFPK